MPATPTDHDNPGNITMALLLGELRGGFGDLTKRQDELNKQLREQGECLAVTETKLDGLRERIDNLPCPQRESASAERSRQIAANAEAITGLKTATADLHKAVKSVARDARSTWGTRTTRDKLLQALRGFILALAGALVTWTAMHSAQGPPTPVPQIVGPVAPGIGE